MTSLPSYLPLSRYLSKSVLWHQLLYIRKYLLWIIRGGQIIWIYASIKKQEVRIPLGTDFKKWYLGVMTSVWRGLRGYRKSLAHTPAGKEFSWLKTWSCLAQIVFHTLLRLSSINLSRFTITFQAPCRLHGNFWMLDVKGVSRSNSFRGINL